MPSDDVQERNGVFSRIYARQKARGGRARGGPDADRDRGRRRDQDRSAKRGRKGSEDDERDSELRIRGDAMALELRRRLDAIGDQIDSLDDLMRDTLTKPADGMGEAQKQFVARLGVLEDEGSIEDDLLGDLTKLGIELDELEDSVALAIRQMKSPRVKAAVTWAESYAATQLFPSVRQDLLDLGDALAEGYPVDLPAIARFCETIEDAKAQADAATNALKTLHDDRATKVSKANDALKWLGDESGRSLAGPIVSAIEDVERLPLETLGPSMLPAEARAAAQRKINEVDQWAGAVDNGIRKDKYISDIFSEVRSGFDFLTVPGKPEPPFKSAKAMGDALLEAVLTLPASAPDMADALVRAKSCPGRWVRFLAKDEAFAEEQRKTAERDKAIGTLSSHLQTAWTLAAAAADPLARQMFTADPKALAKLTSSGLTHVTWDLMHAHIGYAFDTMADIFKAIDRLKTETELSALAGQRLQYGALTAANLNGILASGAARITSERGYPYEPPGYPKTIGASAVIEWTKWMPGGAKAYAWGAVHLHFTGTDVASAVSVVHLKDFETHTAGGMGKVPISRTGTGAMQVIAAIRAKNFSV